MRSYFDERFEIRLTRSFATFRPHKELHCSKLRRTRTQSSHESTHARFEESKCFNYSLLLFALFVKEEFVVLFSSESVDLCALVVIVAVACTTDIDNTVGVVVRDTAALRSQPISPLPWLLIGATLQNFYLFADFDDGEKC